MPPLTSRRRSVRYFVKRMVRPCGDVGQNAFGAAFATEPIAGHRADAGTTEAPRISVQNDARTDAWGLRAETRKRFAHFLSLCAFAHGGRGGIATTNINAKHRSLHRPPTIVSWTTKGLDFQLFHYSIKNHFCQVMHPYFFAFFI